MAAALLGGAAIGAGFGEVLSLLCDAIKYARKRDAIFKPSLDRLESTINSLNPLMEEIEEFNRILDRGKEETNALIRQMEEGESLIRKCLKTPWFKYWAKTEYASKIEQLDHSILRFIQVNLQAQMARDNKETLVTVKSIARNGDGGWLCAVPKPPADIVGMDVPLKELKMELFKDEVSLLVLTAPAGCGKTTLVKMLGHDQEIKGKFEGGIFFVTVSNTPNLKVILQRLLNQMGDKAAEFHSDEDAINQLEHLLNQIVSNDSNPVLLILDDVWSGSETLLDKFKFCIPNYKILVTSRFAFPRFHSYNLKPLNDKDAMELFRHSADLQVENSSIPDGIVKKIVRFCGGLPLALTVIGKSLCGQPVEVWKSREKKWSNGLSILDSNKDLLLHLESSLDFLDEDIKRCFMDLGSFPEDQKIPAAALIDIWVELYEVDEVDVIANLHELTKCNLASLVVTRKVSSETDRCYNEDFVIQHDLLRELAIRQSSQEPIEQRKKLNVDISGNKFPEWWMEQNEQSISTRLLPFATGWFNLLQWWTKQKKQTVNARFLSISTGIRLLSFATGLFNLLQWWTEQKKRTVNARLLSISTDEMFSSNWCNMQPLEVEVLVLNFQTKNYTLPKFMEKMGKLKVLIATNNGFFPTEVSNFQLLGSIPNLKRIRLEKVSIDSLFKNLVSLKSLKKISLFMCSIGQAFRNCTIQISDALPNLVEINIDYCNDLMELPDELCDIVHLKKLSITNCHKLFALPEGIGKLVNLEVLRLRSCTDLLEFPESISCLHKLSIFDISDCLSLTKLPEHIGELCNLKELHVNGCSSLPYELPLSTLDLEQLEVVICDEEGAGLWNPIKDFLSGLKVKIIENDINLNWLANKVV